jgi:hypothetical protein
MQAAADAGLRPQTAHDLWRLFAGYVRVTLGRRGDTFPAIQPQEASMAKGQQRQPKEKKKPKAEAKDKQQSGYKAQYGGKK